MKTCEYCGWTCPDLWGMHLKKGKVFCSAFCMLDYLKKEKTTGYTK